MTEICFNQSETGMRYSSGIGRRIRILVEGEQFAGGQLLQNRAGMPAAAKSHIHIHATRLDGQPFHTIIKQNGDVVQGGWENSMPQKYETRPIKFRQKFSCANFGELCDGRRAVHFFMTVIFSSPGWCFT